MLEIILLVLVGSVIGYFIRGLGLKKIKIDAALSISELKRQIETLRQANTRMHLAESKRTEEVMQRRRFFEENDVSDVENQIRFISQCDLRPVRPVNQEAAKVLYALDEWMRKHEPQWRLSFEVSMGAFVKTAFDLEDRLLKAAFSSYNSKRVDFLLIDRFGNSALVVEYHGSGHALSEDASDRMEVKRLALQRAGIPLLEIPARTKSAEIIGMVKETLASRATAASPANMQSEAGK